MGNKKSNERFFNFWAGFYDHGPFSTWLRSMQEAAIGPLDIPKGSRILDISCGTGYGLSLLTGKGHELIGIDLSEKMIALAQENLTDSIDVTLMLAEVDAIPFKDASFDYVISMEAFHHYPDQKNALQEMYRVLKPGGMLILSDMEIGSKSLHWMFSKMEPGCNRVNSKGDMLEMMENQGFLVESQKRIKLCAVVTYAHRPATSTKDL